jgi:uncharacterized membrane protein
MSVNAADARAPGSHTFLVVMLAALAILLSWFAAFRLHYLTDYSLASYTDYYWPRRAALIPHLLGGAVAISAGLLQIWLGLTHRVGALHRALGKVYASGVLIGSLGSLYLALTIPAHLAYAAGLFMLCVAWVLTTSMALYAVRKRRLEQHREWMLRSYTVTFAFVTFRLVGYWLHRWISVPDDPVADQIDTLLAWGCWAVPLLLAEPLIQLRAMRRSSARS